MISVLIADDERPALDELEYLLRGDARIGGIHRASSGAEALRMLSRTAVDAALLDIHMPGLSGFDLARSLARLAAPPALVFVTADEEGAVEAFDVAAVDFLLKPVRPERLERSISRVIQALGRDTQLPITTHTIPVTAGSTTRLVQRRDVRWVQAQGDYARLFTDDGNHLVRMVLSELETQWSGAGYLRIHRSYLVEIASVTRARLGGNAPVVMVGEVELPVSRRMLPAVREALVGKRMPSAR